MNATVITGHISNITVTIRTIESCFRKYILLIRGKRYELCFTRVEGVSTICDGYGSTRQTIYLISKLGWLRRTLVILVVFVAVDMNMMGWNREQVNKYRRAYE